MEKKYHSKFPRLRMGLGVRFVNGEFKTSDPTVQLALETSRSWKSGQVTLVEQDGEAVAAPKAHHPTAPSALLFELVKANKEELIQHLRASGVEVSESLTRAQLLGMAVRMRNDEASTTPTRPPAAPVPAPPRGAGEAEADGQLPSTDGTL